MAKIIMLKGLPASGKSTWAKEQVTKGQGNVIRVNKDSLREMLHEGRHSKGREALVKSIRDSIIQEAITTNPKAVVIVDDTNFFPEHERILRIIADMHGAEFEVNDSFLEVPLEECLKRDKLRVNSVGKSAILNMYNQYLKGTYCPRPDDPMCTQCDLDGTLAKFEGNPYNRDFLLDTPNQEVLFLLYAARQAGDVIMFLSGRLETHRDVTVEWIFKNTSLAVSDYELYMRKEGDQRPDYVVKEEMWYEFVEPRYNVRCVIDDRPQVVRLWRGLGLFVFDVNQSGVEF